MSDDTRTDVGERLSVEELVAGYVQAEAEIRASFGTIRAALDRLDATLAGESWRGFHLTSRSGHHETNWAIPDEHLIHLRRQVWERLIERSQIRRAMSIAAWKKLEDEVEHEDPPEVTIENVNSLIAQFREDGPAMLEAAVHEVFEFLRPHGDRYKTNSQFEIGERVVLSHCVTRGYGRTWSVSDHREQHLQALENVFTMLDGKRPDRSDGYYYSRLSGAIKAVDVGEPCQGSTDLFAFKGYRNGNMHLRFVRMDLVAKLNAVAGGMRLKPQEGHLDP